MAKRELWEFKYSPQGFDEIIMEPNLKEQLRKNLDNRPNMLLHGPPGVGKGCYVDELIRYNQLKDNYLKINCSMEGNIDNIRGKVMDFASSMSFDNTLKLVYLNECLEENEEIFLSNSETKKMKNLPKGEKFETKSLNMETGEIEDDIAEIVSDKIDDVYEIELEDGRKIRTNKNHPFLILRSRSNGYMFIELNALESEDLIFVLGETSKIIKSINYIGKTRVINLNVKNNSTIISKNGIVTHNCDHPNIQVSQQSLRQLIEDTEKTTQFVLVCNYVQNVIPELISRCQVFNISDPPAKEILQKCMKILDNEGVQYKKKSVLELVKSVYPDVRSTIVTLQQNVVNGQLKESISLTPAEGIFKEVFDAMKSGDPEQVRKILKSNAINYKGLYEYLYKQLMETEGDVFKNDATAILLIGEHYYRSEIVSIQEVNFMHMYFRFLTEGVL